MGAPMRYSDKTRILKLLNEAQFALYEAWVAAEEIGHPRWREISDELGHVMNLQQGLEREFFGYVR
jgi:hypothetical protein